MNEIASYPSLENKVVIITGGASGIGASIVEQFIIQKSIVAFIDIEEEIGKNLVNTLFKKIFFPNNLTDLLKTLLFNFLSKLKNS